jgi:acyl transferase domain-containing protein
MTVARDTPQTERADIAIVGMSGRFPGARTLEAFWQNLKDGVESRTQFSDEEILAQGLSSASLTYPGYVKSGFVIDDVDCFDSRFFGFNPREADVLDPQHRLFLECAWEALEDAGYDTERYPGAVAVFGGATFGGYLHYNVMRNIPVVKSVGGRQAVYGSVPEYMVTRVSYKLNLRGPCCFVQTACSTSLVAVHLGCQSLNNHESDMVLAGGVSVQFPNRLGYLYEEGGMLSPDGVCRTFDIRAQGTVFSSGVGIVVLKRLADAIADGDCIHAVIAGIATNNDGAFKVGFTAPSVTGQAQVVAEAMANAGVHPDTISYVEAHGTGTELGDPIEVAALTRAYRATTDRKGFCALGSIKPNVGHLDAAAGVSSLMKTVMSLERRQIPPTINFEHPNPKIDFENSPFFVNTTLRPWPANGEPRRAGVSSFGFGGTNVHLIVEEAPPVASSGSSRSQQLLVLSAKTEEALDAATKRLGDHLGDRPQLNLADAAFTLQVGRRLFAHRRAVVCTTVGDAVDALQGGDARRVFGGQAAGGERSVVFMFPGQGSQYLNMGLGLYREEAVFRGSSTTARSNCSRISGSTCVTLSIRRAVPATRRQSDSNKPR